MLQVARVVTGCVCYYIHNYGQLLVLLLIDYSCNALCSELEMRIDVYIGVNSFVCNVKTVDISLVI